MTPEEALEYILANWFDGNEDVKSVVGGDEETMAMKTAVEALEKQIPIKPNNVTVEKYTVSYWCPKCGTKHINEWCSTEWKLPFCSICGQALDWSDIE